LNSISQKY